MSLIVYIKIIKISQLFYIKKKYGFRVAQKLFSDNPKKLVDDIINTEN